MSQRMLKLAALGLAAAVFAVACTSAAPTPTATPPAKAPAATASAKTGDAPSGTADVARGRAVFTANCAGCHGQNAEGGVGPDLRKVGASRDRDFLTRFVGDPQAVKPGSPMPKLPLSQDDLKAVVEYLLTLK